MRRYRLGSHSGYDLKVHLVWVPKYRKRVLTGAVAVRVRDLLWQITAENDLHIIWSISNQPLLHPSPYRRGSFSCCTVIPNPIMAINGVKTGAIDATYWMKQSKLDTVRCSPSRLIL